VWTGKHELWLRSHAFTAPGRQLAYDAAFDAMVSAVDRRDRLDEAIVEMAADSVFTPVVTRLGCLRGISTLIAFGLAVEIGDWQRLSGRSIGAYLGLVPTENSSGATRSLRAGSPRPATAMPAACWSKPPVITDPATGQGAIYGGAGRRRLRQPESAAKQPTGD
jgi:transposase